jgi:hypothetical protein
MGDLLVGGPDEEGNVGRFLCSHKHSFQTKAIFLTACLPGVKSTGMGFGNQASGFGIFKGFSDLGQILALNL